MRRTVLLALPLAAVLAGCVSSKVDRDGTILTPAEANRAGLGGAVTAPLRDVNVLRTKIPATLLVAAAEPYARPADLGCGGLIAEVRALNEALGPDVDEASDCPASRDYSKAYLHHLVKSDEILGQILLSWHNIAFFQAVMAAMRGAVAQGRFEAFRSDFAARHRIG